MLRKCILFIHFPLSEIRWSLFNLNFNAAG